MSDQLPILLRRASGDLLVLWAARCGLSWTMPDSAQDRSSWASLIVPELALNAPKALAQLRKDADDITEIADPSKDWIFPDLLRHFPNLRDIDLRQPDPWSRALWLWLHDREAHKWCARRAQVFDPFGKPKLFSRFRCQPADDFFLSDSALGPFVEELKTLYRNHDFSGEDIIPTPDWELDQDGQRIGLTLHAEVARLPSYEANISEAGERDDQLLRKPTIWRCRFEFATGQLDLYCDRGGKALRFDSADAFVRLVLGQDAAPGVIDAPAMDLEKLADLSGLPLMPGQTSWAVLELCLRDPATPEDTYTVRSERDAWAAALRLTHAPYGEAGGFLVESAIVRAVFEDGTGPGKRAEKTAQVEVYADGRVRAGKSGKRIKDVRNHIEAYLCRDGD